MKLADYLCAHIAGKRLTQSIHPMTFEDTKIAFQHKTTAELRRTQFVFSTMNWPWMVSMGTFTTTLALRLGLPVKGLIRSTLFRLFCGGESITDCADTIRHLGEFNVQTILDYSVEGQEDEKSFDHALEEAQRVASYAKDQSQITFCVIKPSGLGSRELMARVQAGEKLQDIEQQQFERFKERLEILASHVRNLGLQFMIDAEESWIQDVVDEIIYDLMIRHNKERCVVLNTYQLYRTAALENMKRGYSKVTEAGCFFGAKLVRGAYMETERERAEELGYRDPIHATKADTDKDYNAAILFAIAHIDRFSVCAGTHNEDSASYLADLLDEKNISRNDPRVYFAQLLGMSDNISFRLAEEGFNVAKYVPYGPVEKVLPYLFRRAEENTSIAGQSGRELSLVRKELKRRKG